MDFILDSGISPNLLINVVLGLTLALLLLAVNDLQKRGFSQKERFMWLALVVLLPVIGALLYLLIGKRMRKRV